jgi:hypothetical protein
VAGAQVFDEGRGAAAQWTPTLSGSPPPSLPGTALAVSGTLFTGVSEAASGSTQASATNFPIFLLEREDNEQFAYARVESWSATQASVTLPASLQAGWHWMTVIVNAVPSPRVPVLILPPPLGQPDAGADSGVGTDAGMASDAGWPPRGLGVGCGCQSTAAASSGWLALAAALACATRLRRPGRGRALVPRRHPRRAARARRRLPLHRW